MPTKICFKCGSHKPLSAFYAHSGMKDGRLNKCKECTKADAKANRDLNIDRVRAYDKARGNRQTAEYRRAYIAKNREKIAAQNAVSRAIKSGKLAPMPCEVCGASPTHGHHDDYSKKLDVRWLCAACHSQFHATAVGRSTVKLRDRS